MKIKANHWVKYNGVWHRAGEEFDIDEKDAEMMKEYTGTPDSPAKPEEKPETKPEEEAETAPQEEPVKRGRKRKNAE